MTSFRSQHRHVLSTGVVVERLPLGFAAGRWWTSFVFSAPGGDGLLDPRAVISSVSVGDPDGLLDRVGGSGGGSHGEHEFTWELVDDGARRARVGYLEEGEEVANELLALDPTDRTDCFAIRLPDGSLVERLPLGRAHGSWRLRWVRSDLPPAEAASDDEDAIMPHLRFVRLRSSAGPVDPVGASGALCGAIQPFGVNVPDTVAPLEVEYVDGDELVGTEVVPLPTR